MMLSSFERNREREGERICLLRWLEEMSFKVCLFVFSCLSLDVIGSRMRRARKCACALACRAGAMLVEAGERQSSAGLLAEGR